VSFVCVLLWLRLCMSDYFLLTLSFFLLNSRNDLHSYNKRNLQLIPFPSLMFYSSFYVYQLRSEFHPCPYTRNRF
jgi:hypothetical protein